MDVDELLLHRLGPDGLLAQLDDPDYGTVVKPSRAAHLLDHTLGLNPYDKSRPISDQRPIVKMDRDYEKRALTSVHVTWDYGFHEVFEESIVTEDPDLWLIHLQLFDLEFAAERERVVWVGTPQSNYDKAYVDSGLFRTGTIEGLAKRVREKSVGGTEHLPNWMIGQF